MANPPPLPPVVDGPVFDISPQVYVDNVLPNAKVNVYNDAASTNLVGTATSTSPGAIWVPFSKPISAGQPITARQEYTGSDPAIQVTGLSAPSNVPVPVLPVPSPLPSPIFVSGFCTCMDSVLMDGLIPGANLTVDLETISPPGAKTLVNARVTQTPQWFTLATVTIPAGSTLRAWQSIGALKSPVTPGPYPVPVASPLEAPVVALPLLNCETTIGVSNLVPGADLKIVNGGNEDSVTNPWNSYNFTNLIPLVAGPLTAQQYFTRCDRQERGPTATFPVVKQPPKFPKVAYTPCADVTELGVSNLLGGEILTVSVSYHTHSGSIVKPLGSQGVSGATAIVNLPKSWYPSGAIGAVTLRVAVTLCDNPLPSPGYTEVHVAEPPGPFAAPTVQAPLFDCATSVFIQAAHPGSLIQVFSSPLGFPRSNPVVATTANFSIKLWTPLVTGESIFASQLGCNATGQSPHVPVRPAPKLPPPVVAGPVVTGAPSIFVQQIVPGAQVLLFVDGAPRVGVDSIAAEIGPPQGTPPFVEVSMPVGLPSLVEGQTVSAGQALCSEVEIPKPRQGGVTVQVPLPAPSSGPGEPGGTLGSNNNYFMFAPTAGGGCANLLGVSVTIQVTEPIVCESNGPPTSCGSPPPPTIRGFGFQLNCYSPRNNTCAWQQYIISLQGTQLSGLINTWPLSGPPIIAPPNNSWALPLVTLTGLTIPAPFEMQIILGNDGSGNVTKVTFVVNGTPFPQSIPAILAKLGQPTTDIAPIVAFTLGLVGPGCSESAVLSSGAGLITYSAENALTVTNAESGCAEFTEFTAETATSSYSGLPANPGNPFTQTFAASATTPLIRRFSRGPRLSRG